MTLTLSAGQQAALQEILAARQPNTFHLLTGYAGSGKTTLMQEVARSCLGLRLSVVMTAPTHKAVAVLARKLREAGLSDVPCVTLHSLLSLRPAGHEGEVLRFERMPKAEPVTADVVVVDECSMVSEDLMKHIRRHLRAAFVLFVGDPAQLPPVGEIASQTFDTKSRSHLDTIIRQAAGNPVLAAAHTIRTSQGGPMNWDWMVSANAPPVGVFRPRDAAQWMQRAFTSEAFDADADAFRYLCWTNARVAEVNRKVRRWRYGDDIPTPFVVGEMALARAPVMLDSVALLNTNEEARVLSIQPGEVSRAFQSHMDCEGWQVTLPCWNLNLFRGDRSTVAVSMVRDDKAMAAVTGRLADEARDGCRERWGELFGFKSSLAQLQSVYAMTVHVSQGSTFRNAFVDVADIRKRVASNVLEGQQLFYVAATRASHALVLVNS